jgi:hypothetical protein
VRDQHAQVKAYFSRRMDLTGEEIALLLSDPNQTVRLNCAKRADLTPEQVEACVSDPDPNLRYFVARNPLLTEAQRRRLLADSDDLVRIAARKGPKQRTTRCRPDKRRCCGEHRAGHRPSLPQRGEETLNTATRKPRRWWRWLLELLLIVAVVLLVRAWLARDLAQGPAPEFEANLLDGSAVSLADYADRPMLLHFWATWCPICRLEEGEIMRLSRSHPVLTVAMQSGSPWRSKPT